GGAGDVIHVDALAAPAGEESGDDFPGLVSAGEGDDDRWAADAYGRVGEAGCQRALHPSKGGIGTAGARVLDADKQVHVAVAPDAGAVAEGAGLTEQGHSEGAAQRGFDTCPVPRGGGTLGFQRCQPAEEDLESLLN